MRLFVPRKESRALIVPLYSAGGMQHPKQGKRKIAAKRTNLAGKSLILKDNSERQVGMRAQALPGFHGAIEFWKLILLDGPC